MEGHEYFYPGSFETQTTSVHRQGDFASLNENLIHYNQTDYKCTTKLGVIDHTMHKPTASD